MTFLVILIFGSRFLVRGQHGMIALEGRGMPSKQYTFLQVLFLQGLARFADMITAQSGTERDIVNMSFSF